MEIIVGIAALLQGMFILRAQFLQVAQYIEGELRIVQTSVRLLIQGWVKVLTKDLLLQMLGSILGNILLVLGSSFIAGGWTSPEGHFQVTAAQTSVVPFLRQRQLTHIL